MVHVDIHCDTVGTHLLQIFSALYLLQQQGRICIRFKRGLALTKMRPNRQFIALRVSVQEQVADPITLLFDLQDSPALGLPNVFDQVDFYVKRSLEPETYNGLNQQQSKKLLPFGLNYQVLSFSPAFFLKMFTSEFISRPYNPFGKKHNFHVHNLKDLFDACWLKKQNGLLGGKDLSPCASAAHSRKVLFQCRLWDVEGVAEKNKDDTHKVNQSRIALIRELKRELGAHFIGGLQNTAYARVQAPDLISTMPSARRDYIQLVRDAAIVVSSSGLLKSNGWKLGEYVALGKCIVSEPIHTQLPGDFAENKNYLKYESVVECLENITSLMSSPDNIAAMEQQNSVYFREYLEASAIMWNILSLALGQKNAVNYA